MVALAPDSMKYRMEIQYADTDLGVVLSDQRRFTEAVAQFTDALNTMDAISTADPSNQDYKQSVAESLTWLSDAERAIGNYDRAIAHRQRTVAIYNQLLAQTGSAKYREHLVPALRSLGTLYFERGQAPIATELLRASIAQADTLVTLEPANAIWLEYDLRGRLVLARLLLVTGKRDEAAAQTSAGCQAINTLLKRPSVKPDWRNDLFGCFTLRAQLSLAKDDKQQAVLLANQALETAKTVHTADAPADAFRVARAYRLVGDIARDSGDVNGARSAWNSGLAAIPAGVTEQPDEIAEHAAILQRLGQVAQAQQLNKRLTAMGYRREMERS
jgi:tetratricopeptide (TPR) repeat protein